jgi:hypothetical protein
MAGDHRADRFGWDDLNPILDRIDAAAKRQRREQADRRRLAKMFHVDQANEPSWVYRKDGREW